MNGTTIWALLAGRLLLALLFASAAAAKLAGPGRFRETLAEFGLHVRAARAGAVVLPIVELAIAVALVGTATARWGALGAVVLLAAFCAAIGRALARGERPDCGCLGRIRATPIGAGTLVRNAVLAAAAASVFAAGPGKSAGRAFAGVQLSALALVVAALAGVVAVLVLFAWELFRQHGRLLARLRALEGTQTAAPDGLAVGDAAPPLEALDERLLDGSPVALVFSSTVCGACETLAPAVERLREQRDGELEILVVADDRAALEAYRIFTVPSATIVAVDGRIATATAVGATAVEGLLASAARPHERLRLATA